MRERLGQIEKKLDTEAKLRDTVADIDSHLLALVSLTFTLSHNFRKKAVLLRNQTRMVRMKKFSKL